MPVLKCFRPATKNLPDDPRIAVVISTWIGNPPDYLLRLMDSMNTHGAGMDYDLFLCANGETYKLPETLQNSFIKIFIRETMDLTLVLGIMHGVDYQNTVTSCSCKMIAL